MTWLFFIQKLNQILIERNLAMENQSILVAVSGGQDSACLLQAIRNLCPFWRWNLGIVSCDHAWFDLKSKPCLQISQLAWYNQIKCYQSIIPKQAISEAKARSWRYESFARIGRSHHYSQILTGHTASDRAETLFYSLLRGSSQAGLQSLSWQRKLDFGIFLTRPMLTITRSQSAMICKRQNFCIVLDPSNQRNEWHRNRIRRQILPYLRKYFNPKTDQILCHLAELAHAEACYITALSNNLELKFYKKNFICLPISLQRRFIYSYFKHKQIKQTFYCIELARFSFFS
uniref:hypothetical chloroplast RF62 n=1 Tax=Klebsormidium elegans TaxID=424407 RepID=UPI00286BD07D|nr:hypothetical chloroplast RF62 [Klebsormidium elegans]WKT06720.1 hypothetical chloroplast RF62 [Klebsormidium elegans]